MLCSSRGEPACRMGWSAIVACAFLTLVMAVGAPNIAAQTGKGFPPAPTVTPVPHEFSGTWRGPNPRGAEEGGGNCGSLKDHYGNPRELCEFPVDKLEPHLNGRMRAWIEFFDEPLSPKWSCVSAGIQTGLQEGYLWEFSTTPDALIQRWEQSNWVRYIYMDGRPHPPSTEIYYHGHSIGRVESPTVLVVDTTNFTFDPDGWDDHSHLATSTRKHLTERYIITGPDTMTIEFTVDDPVFLKSPFTWKHNYRKTQQTFVSAWDCDPEAGLEELYRTIPQRYPDDSEFDRYNK